MNQHVLTSHEVETGTPHSGNLSFIVLTWSNFQEGVIFGPMFVFKKRNIEK